MTSRPRVICLLFCFHHIRPTYYELEQLYRGGGSFSTACKPRVVVALRLSRMYAFQVTDVVLYSLEGGSLERASNSGWAVTVWLFGVTML